MAMTIIRETEQNADLSSSRLGVQPLNTELSGPDGKMGMEALCSYLRSSNRALKRR
jgi:hypothetical protein